MWWGSEENAWEQGGLREAQGQVTDSYMENVAHETEGREIDMKRLL